MMINKILIPQQVNVHNVKHGNGKSMKMPHLKMFVFPLKVP